MNEELINLDEFKEENVSEQELFSFYDNSSINSEKITAPRYSYWKSVFRVFFKKKVNFVVLALLAIVFLLAYIYPMIFGLDHYSNLDPNKFHLRTKAAFATFGPSIRYILGTGAHGQSVWDEMWYGARLSITLAVICAAINMTIGVVLGAIWGFSKKVDLVMTEVYNIVGNVPYILLISVFTLIFSPSFKTMIFALTITGWIGIAYFIRTQVIIIRDREYNLASRCLGTPILRLTMKNILPFMTSVIVTLLATELPSYISYEVFLAYIGLGIQDTTLGRVISNSQNNMFTSGWQIEFWAPVAIASIITIVLYVVGQNLGDASDPRTHM